MFDCVRTKKISVVQKLEKNVKKMIGAQQTDKVQKESEPKKREIFVNFYHFNLRPEKCH